ncbi:MAG: GspH/FimT family pseudopilin [Planctomycetota bacterium]|nr:GspH/FimT family pseudopilin [Planctomycetota bacterium]
MKRLNGFTLIELMAVILIIALATGIVVTNLDYFSPKYSLRAEARMISGNFEYARSSAIRQNKTFSLVYDLDENSYSVLLPAETDEEGRILEEERKTAGGSSVKLKYGVKLAAVIMPDGNKTTSGTVQVDISPFGETGSHIVVLKRADDDEQSLYIRMDSYLGTTEFSTKELSFFPEEEEKDEQATTP